MRTQNLLFVMVLLGMASNGYCLSVLEYPYAPYNLGKLDPQITGWPLIDSELTWVSKTEYTRKPGHEASQHLPAMWPVTQTAAHWKGKDPASAQKNVWIDHHATLVAQVQAAKKEKDERGDIDIVLFGDSITQGWGGGFDGQPFNSAWKKHFSTLRTLNLGIGGDRVENILWRLDHGAVDGISPKIVILLIGVNNAPLVTANGIPVESVAMGISLVVKNLRARCPQTKVLVMHLLPAFKPGGVVHEDIKRINHTVAEQKLDADPQVFYLDLWRDFTNQEGSLTVDAYSDGHLHLGAVGYERYAAKLKPMVDRLLADQAVNTQTRSPQQNNLLNK